ncbi:MAG TPA: diguanylate cyclase [Thermoleophilaceae bacterium]|nr:diguanylate cyclase [Thermoleophilaceae bacterium]
MQLRAAWSVEQHRLQGRRALALPGSIGLASLALLAAGQVQPLQAGAALVAAAALAGALVWFALAVAHNMRALAGSRHDSLTDALTGLQNRRSLNDDLEDALTGATDERPTVLVLLDLDGFKQYNDNFGHPAGDALLARLAASLHRAVAPHGRAYRLGGDEFCALFTAPGNDTSHLAAAAAAAMCQSGRGFSITASHGMAVLPSEAHTSSHALQLADQRLYERKSGRQRSGTAEQIRDALVQALEERQPELRGRLDGVAALTRAVARALELSSDDIDVLVRAAELHDVGKVAVPEAILSKPGPLDAVEWGFVRQHTIVGERILSAAPALVPVAKLVRCSHERYDGTGYPDGLAGEEIPLGARIISVCDAYHAMTSTRPYERALSRDEALEELRRCAGQQFDPAVVRSFRDVAVGLPEAVNA